MTGIGAVAVRCPRERDRVGEGGERIRLNILWGGPRMPLLKREIRFGEVLGAVWQEIDLDAKVWTIPLGRMKAGREHRVPLSEAAMTILQAMPDRSGFLFPGMRSSQMPAVGMWKLLRDMGVGGTVHGLRSSFRDWCGEETDFPREIAEAALAHAVGGAVEQAYRRGVALSKRRALMEAWAAFVA